MRYCALLMTAVVLGILGVVSTGPARALALVARAKQPRATRGFKNSELMTARGFGKRDPKFTVPGYHGAYGFGKRSMRSEEDIFQGHIKDPEEQNILAILADQMPDSVPVEWFVSEMMMNPELTESVLHRFVDLNQDGELTAAELLREDF